MGSVPLPKPAGAVVGTAVGTAEARIELGSPAVRLGRTVLNAVGKGAAVPEPKPVGEGGKTPDAVAVAIGALKCTAEAEVATGAASEELDGPAKLDAAAAEDAAAGATSEELAAGAAVELDATAAAEVTEGEAAAEVAAATVVAGAAEVAAAAAAAEPVTPRPAKLLMATSV